MDFPSFDYLDISRAGDVAIIAVDRADKRNALSLAVIEELVTCFTLMPRMEVGAVVLRGAGAHFSAGLDLVEHLKAKRTAADFMAVCLRWHEAFNKMEYGGIPIIGAISGACVGGGLELASAAHVRVIDHSAFFSLPEGQRGLFTGGGATIRVSGLIGKSRMIDMMLTGRQYAGQEALDVGLAEYLVEDAFAKALELAKRTAENPRLSNFAICSAISHMGNMSALDAAYAESVVAGVVNTQEAAQERLETFAAGKAKLARD